MARWGGSWLDGAGDCYLIIMQANIRHIMKFFTSYQDIHALY